MKSLMLTLILIVFSNAFSQEQKLSPSDTQGFDHFGESVAISGNYSVVGNPDHDANGSKSGAVYIFKKENDIWDLKTKILPQDGGTNDRFGSAVSIYGTTILIGAEGDSTNNLENSGSAYIYKRTGENWNFVVKVTAGFDSKTNYKFGQAVTISDDIALVGANHDVGTDGEVFPFHFDGATWNPLPKIISPELGIDWKFGQALDSYQNDFIIGGYNTAYHYTFFNGQFYHQHTFTGAGRFGHSVSIYSNYFAIGSPNLGVSNNAGNVDIFKRNSLGGFESQWVHVTTVSAPNENYSNHFGYSVSLNGVFAGQGVLVVGAPRSDAGNYGTNENGAVFVFQRDNLNWNYSAAIVPSDAASFDHFGTTICLGPYDLIVGVPDGNDFGSQSGSAYIYNDFEDIQAVPDVNFNQLEENDFSIISPLDAAENDYFAKAVDISDSFAVCGASWKDNGGAAYIFKPNVGNWVQDQKLIPSIPPQPSDLYGHSVATDGNFAFVGIPWADDSGDKSGAVVVFEKQNGNWVEQQRLIPNDASLNQYFGWSVSVNDSFAIVGANGDWNNENQPGLVQTGAAYIFKNIGGTWTQIEKLVPSDGAAQDYFGAAVAIHRNFAVVGAYKNDGSWNDTGAAYFYERIADNDWSNETKILPSTPTGTGEFGFAVDIFGDYAIIGEPHTNLNGYNSGSAYIFKNEGNGNWTQQVKLNSLHQRENEDFGNSVSIANGRAIVGGKRGVNAATVFIRNDDVWSYQHRLNLSNHPYFGYKVAISNSQAIIGDELKNFNFLDSGVAYIYTFSGNNNGMPVSIPNGNAVANPVNVNGGGTAQLEDGSGNRIADLELPPNSADSFQATVSTDDPVNVGGLVAPSFNLANRWWNLTPTNFSGTNTVRLTLYLNQSELGTLTPATAQIYHYEISTDTYELLTNQSVDLSNFPVIALSADANSFSPFVIGDEGDSPLSVGLSSFEAKQVENSVKITWTTESETDNLGFAIYRNEGKEFVKIASYESHEELKSKNPNASFIQNYEFFDEKVEYGKTYTYQLADVDFSKVKTLHEGFEQTVTVLENEEKLAANFDYELKQNFPNPFNPSTKIEFSLKKESLTKLTVYNILGQLVKTLVSEKLIEGKHSIQWNGTNEFGKQVSSGIYYFKISTESGFTETKKMILLK